MGDDGTVGSFANSFQLCASNPGWLRAHKLFPTIVRKTRHIGSCVVSSVFFKAAVCVYVCVSCGCGHLRRSFCCLDLFSHFFHRKKFLERSLLITLKTDRLVDFLVLFTKSNLFLLSISVVILSPQSKWSVPSSSPCCVV